ncbi:hypothetical protein J6590_034301 [Homalodisca vitripennis]|nr:hypothetical protein J6590_034301 [Homalodisca vitripennis]
MCPRKGEIKRLISGRNPAPMGHGCTLVSVATVQQRESTDPSLPIRNSNHTMLARCAALCATCSYRKKLTRACKVQAQITP